MAASSLRLGIIIITSGRKEVVGRWRSFVDEQTVKPSCVVFSITNAGDIESSTFSDPIYKIIIGDRGTCQQRNRGIDAIIDTCDIVGFFDDDYIPTSNCFENIIGFFAGNSDLAGATGHLIYDGINSPDIDFERADTIIKAYENAPRKLVSTKSGYEGLYGCNMVFLARAIGCIRFDENLPLYAWQEDIDFGSQVSKNGSLVKTDAFAGVHLGIKSGRTSGVKLGYSQICNPIYLARKGTMSWSHALKVSSQNFIMNHIKSLYPEPWIDRLGRVKGNWIAVIDVIRRIDDPKRILSL